MKILQIESTKSKFFWYYFVTKSNDLSTLTWNNKISYEVHSLNNYDDIIL